MTDLHDPRLPEPHFGFPLEEFALVATLFLLASFIAFVADDPFGRLQSGCLGTFLLIAFMIAVAYGTLVLVGAS